MPSDKPIIYKKQTKLVKPKNSKKKKVTFDFFKLTAVIGYENLNYISRFDLSLKMLSLAAFLT